MAPAAEKNQRQKQQQIAQRLAHDVGKYVARTARNLPADGSPLPSPLLAMLIGDLYGGGERPGARFARLAEDFAHARIAEVREHFATLDTLESDVRAGQSDAVARAAQIARQIEESLRELARLFARPVGK